jgi:phosphoglycolate phosphatase
VSYPYQLVVFDWEGTIADPLGALVNYLWQEVNQQGWAAFSQSQVRHQLLQGVPKAVKELFPGFSEQQLHATVERAERMVSQERHKVFLFAGVKLLLQQLKLVNIDCALASNKGQLSLENALRASELDAYFRVYRCAGQLPPKPHPAMLQEILDLFHVKAENAVMIGDSFADIEMARSLNVDAIAVDWYASGVWHPDRMGAKAVVSTIEQLSALLGVQVSSSGEKVEQGV